MEKELEEYKKQFFLESKELLETASDNVLKIEANPENKELINSLFRAIHTIKGSAGSFGLQKISEFVHYVENLIGLIRDDKIVVNSEIIDLILDLLDYTSEILQESEAGNDFTIDDIYINSIFTYTGEQKSLKSPEDKSTKTKVISKKKLYIAEGVLRDLQDKYSFGMRAYKILLHYTDEELSNGYDPFVLLKNIYTNSIEYICLTEISVPSLPEFQIGKLYLNPVIYILTREQPENILELAFDESLIELYEFTEVFEDKVSSQEKQKSIDTEIDLSNIDEDTLNEFLNGIDDIYNYLQPSLLEYEKTQSLEELKKIYRYIHTIKGDASYLGLNDIVEASHDLESYIEELKSSEKKPEKVDIEMIFVSIDNIFHKIININNRIRRSTNISDNFYNKGDKGNNDSEFYSLSPGLKEAFFEHLEQICGVITTKLSNLDEINNQSIILRLLKTIEHSSKFTSIQTLNSLVNASIMLFSENPIRFNLLKESIKDTLIFIQGFLGQSKKLGQILIDENIISKEDLDFALKKQKPIGEILLETGKLKEEDLQSALKKQKLMESGRQLKHSSISLIEGSSFMRVDEHKIESFFNLIGELIVARNTYDFYLGELNSKDLQVNNHNISKALKDNLHVISRITNEMQRSVMSLRMVPVKQVFQKYYRVIRDIARKQNKDIELKIVGENVEMDKKVADALSEPMVHLIRNACDHGIEKQEERKKAGKPEQGLITLKASYEGNNILIQIIDDGKGLDKDRILDKAKMMSYPVDSLSEEEIYNLIFLPGLSTADKVTDVSGRGVGMDVVMSTVKSLGGKVRVYSSPNLGTNTSISLPVSMGVSKVLIVETGGSDFAIPLENVIEAIKISKKQIHIIQGKLAFYYRGEVLNLERFNCILNNTHVEYNDLIIDEIFPVQNIEIPIIVLRSIEGKFAIIVDKLKKNIEIAIKPVPKQLQHINLISGVTIMGDGSVVQVINIEEIK
ncbi:MAG: Hpt domain-containing protein [Leptospiraceae bacterium]|nr:Hpt domain-containing protein [Leptospiraceae bacterium]MCP5501025.1 Hpt domain-containing protein [Leptospiraceae bacterium]